VRSALAAAAAAALVLAAAGCGGKTGTAARSGGASVAPASSAFFLRARTDSQDRRVLARLLPRAAAMLERLQRALGPETDVVALDDRTLVALTQPPDRARLDSLLARQHPQLVAEQVGDWRVIARSREAIDRLKLARNGGSLADADGYRRATRGLPAAAPATFYADGAAVVRGLRGRGQAVEPVPGLGRVGWVAGALTRRAGGLGVELRVEGDRIEAAPYAAELPAQVPAPVTLLVDAKGLDRTIEELKGSPALATSRNPIVQALRTGVLDDAVRLFANEAAFYVRPLPGGPEATLIVQVDDEAAADAIVDRLVTLAGAVTRTAPAHETIAGVEATRLMLRKTTVYYGVFDGKLVATTAPSGIRGLRRAGPRLVETPPWRAATVAAGLPDRIAGLAYADVGRALPLVGRLLGVTSELRMPPLGRGLLYATVDGSVLTVRGSVALR